MSADQAYYYYCGKFGGETADLIIGGVFAINGIKGIIKSVTIHSGGVKVVNIALDNGDEALAMMSGNSDDVVILTSKLDDVVDVGGQVYKFKDNEKLMEHFSKHSEQLRSVLGYNTYSVEDYLNDANHVIKNGTYVKERNAFVKFVSGDKYAFVGIDAESNITTFHLKTVEWLKKFAPSLGIE